MMALTLLSTPIPIHTILVRVIFLMTRRYAVQVFAGSPVFDYYCQHGNQLKSNYSELEIMRLVEIVQPKVNDRQNAKDYLKDHEPVCECEISEFWKRISIQVDQRYQRNDAQGTNLDPFSSIFYVEK